MVRIPLGLLLLTKSSKEAMVEASKYNIMSTLCGQLHEPWFGTDSTHCLPECMVSILVGRWWLKCILQANVIGLTRFGIARGCNMCK
jgi:hypothetical protein